MKSREEFKHFVENELDDELKEIQHEALQMVNSKGKYDFKVSFFHQVLTVLKIVSILVGLYLVVLGVVILATDINIADNLDGIWRLTLGLAKESIWLIALIIWFVSYYFKSEANKEKFTQFNKVFKHKIVDQVMNFVFGDYDFDSSRGITKKKINESLIFPHKSGSAYGLDYVKTKVGKTDLKFSEIVATPDPTFKTGIKQLDFEENEQKYSDFNRDIAALRPHMFWGLYVIADFHKEFKCTTIVRPTSYNYRAIGKEEIKKSNLNPYVKKNIVRHFDEDDKRKLSHIYNPEKRVSIVNDETNELNELEPVKLEDPNFSERFKVFTDDQLEARYLLSTSIMQRIKDFVDAHGYSIFLSFKDSNMHLAIAMDRGILEPQYDISEKSRKLSDLLNLSELIGNKSDPMHKKEIHLDDIFDPGQVYELYDDLSFIYNIVDEFNLNTRIWSKE